MSLNDQTVEALHRWAHGDPGSEAAVQITLRTHLVDAFAGDRFIKFGDTREDARLCWEDLLATADGPGGGAYLSTTTRFLAILCESLAHGPIDGTPLDLRDLWLLDPGNRRAVLDALGDHLLPTDAPSPGSAQSRPSD